MTDFFRGETETETENAKPSPAAGLTKRHLTAGEVGDPLRQLLLGLSGSFPGGTSPEPVFSSYSVPAAKVHKRLQSWTIFTANREGQTLAGLLAPLAAVPSNHLVLNLLICTFKPDFSFLFSFFLPTHTDAFT